MTSERKREAERSIQPEKFFCVENTMKLSDIDDLSNELLEMIFSLLSRHDRILCKLVCTRWYLILMESPLFRKDRHIYFNDCILDTQTEPISILMAAQKHYEIFTFGTIHKNYYERPLDWMTTPHILQNVKEINLVTKNFDLIPPRLLIECPLLESLNFYDENEDAQSPAEPFPPKYLSLDFMPLMLFGKCFTDKFFFQASRFLVSFEQVFLDCVLQNIKMVNIKSSSNEPRDFTKRFLLQLKKMIPEQAVINIHFDNLLFDDNRYLSKDFGLKTWIDLFSTTQTKFTLNHFKVNFGGMSKEAIEAFCALDVTYKNFNLEFKESDEYDYDEIDKFLDELKAEQISLKLSALPQIPVLRNFHRITKICLRQTEDVASLKWLEQMKNLKELILVHRTLGHSCTFGHAAIKLENVEKLEIDSPILSSRRCQECFNALKQSFQNVKELKIVAESAVLLEISCWKKLETVKIAIRDFDDFFELEKNSEQFSFSMLREIFIYFNLSVEPWNKEKLTYLVERAFPLVTVVCKTY
ncbi:uncharacterized protein LOC134836888 [Culicoides brevitarsis]|uniref:uncharacterized protein LOC134836888 n=1 Tax=Culicoides brevitarsis TaxID=469753 RepID=UPI00307C506B